MTELLNDTSGAQDGIVLTADTEGRDAVALISLYAAYLIGCYDGEYRRAFSLLSYVERMYRQAERQQSQEQARRKHQEEYDALDRRHDSDSDLEDSGHHRSSGGGTTKRSAGQSSSGDSNSGSGSSRGSQESAASYGENEEYYEGWGSDDETPVVAKPVKTASTKRRGSDPDMY